MRAVILDQETLGEALNFSSLLSLCQWTIYQATSHLNIAERIRDAEIIISNKVILDRQSINAAPHLKLIAVAATGTNNIDLQAASEAGVLVSNVRGYAGASVAQHVFAVLLALATRLIDYSSAIRDDRWQSAPHFCLFDFPITELAGKKLGIVGYGDLGRAVARLARCFDMEVRLAERPGRHSLRPDRFWLEDLLPEVDVLSLHCPLTENTLNLITNNELSRMKSSAILINTARGGIVNETDLASALQNGIIGGAAVDVLSSEPPRQGNPLLDAEIPNLIVTPHIAWASREARQRVVDQLATNIAAFLQGQPVNIVLP